MFVSYKRKPAQEEKAIVYQLTQLEDNRKIVKNFDTETIMQIDEDELEIEIVDLLHGRQNKHTIKGEKV